MKVFEFDEVSLAEVSRLFDLELIGGDRRIRSISLIRDSMPAHAGSLTFANSDDWLRRAAAAGFTAALSQDTPTLPLPEGVSVLITSASPEDCFYEIYQWTIDLGLWRPQKTSISRLSTIAKSAEVRPGAVIEDDVIVESGVVIHENTTLSKGTHVKANAVLGGQGFQIRGIGSSRRIVPHMGGVRIGQGSIIGSNTCVDRGLFGEITRLGRYVMVDNLVHIAHNVVLEDQVTVVASAEISGSVVVKEGAWIGPGAVVNPGLMLGAHSFVGSGATVVRDVQSHALVTGTPARLQRLICTCRESLRESGPMEHVCDSCGQHFTGLTSSRN